MGERLQKVYAEDIAVGRVVRGIARGIGGVVRGGLRTVGSLLRGDLRGAWGGIKDTFKSTVGLAMNALPIAGLAIPGLGLLGLGAKLGPLVGGLAGKLGLGSMGSMFGGIGTKLAGTFGNLFGGGGMGMMSRLGGLNPFSGVGNMLGFGSQSAQCGMAAAGGLSPGMMNFAMAAPMISMAIPMVGGLFC